MKLNRINLHVGDLWVRCNHLTEYPVQKVVYSARYGDIVDFNTIDTVENLYLNECYEVIAQTGLCIPNLPCIEYNEKVDIKNVYTKDHLMKAIEISRNREYYRNLNWQSGYKQDHPKFNTIELVTDDQIVKMLSVEQIELDVFWYIGSSTNKPSGDGWIVESAYEDTVSYCRFKTYTGPNNLTYLKIK